MENKGRPLRIGLKYCGGCRPAYDRVELTKEIKRRLGGRIEFVSPYTEGVSLVLAVQGCPVACADLSPFAQHEVWSVTCPEEAEGFITYIESITY